MELVLFLLLPGSLHYSPCAKEIRQLIVGSSQSDSAFVDGLPLELSEYTLKLNYGFIFSSMLSNGNKR